ncbi:unnamed protein product, partial [Citrullus colocynthis]
RFLKRDLFESVGDCPCLLTLSPTRAHLVPSPARLCFDIATSMWQTTPTTPPLTPLCGRSHPPYAARYQ